MTQSHKKDDPIALRKQLLAMRLELNRQKISHESLLLLEPVEKLRGYKKRLMQGANPMILVAGVSLVSFLFARKRRSVGSVLPMLRMAASLLPLLINHSSQTPENTEATTEDKANKPN